MKKVLPTNKGGTKVERFPDKQRPEISFSGAIDHIKQAQEYDRKVEIEQEHAVWNAYGEYPTLPVGITFMTDVHFGSVCVDYDLLQRHFDIVEQTPNMFLLLGGDLIDAFNSVKHATAMGSDAVGPDEQLEAMMEKIASLDGKGKIGAVQIGNHDDFSAVVGYRFERFLRELQCPVYSGAGDIDVYIGDGGERYKIYWSHTHWGNSRINITNAGKRALQFSSPTAEISLLGHTHQASSEVFDQAGKRKATIVGGTYKLNDGYGRKWGMGSAGEPGYTLMLWPNTHRFEVFRNPDVAQEFLVSQIYKLTTGEDWVDPYTQSKNAGNGDNPQAGE